MTTIPVQVTDDDEDRVQVGLVTSGKLVTGYANAECAVSRTYENLCSVLNKFRDQMKDDIQEGLQEVKKGLESTMELMSNEMQALKDKVQDLQDTSSRDIADLQERMTELQTLIKPQEEEKVEETNVNVDSEANQEMKDRKEKRRSQHNDGIEIMRQLSKNNPFHLERFDTGISMGSTASLEGATIEDHVCG